MTGMNIGFVGLGDMGGPMAKNIAKSSTLVVYDKAGTSSRAPEGATALEDLADVA